MDKYRVTFTVNVWVDSLDDALDEALKYLDDGIFYANVTILSEGDDRE